MLSSILGIAIHSMCLLILCFGIFVCKRKFAYTISTWEHWCRPYFATRC